MTSAEQVTDFVLGEAEEESKPISEIIAALKAHTKDMAEEYDFSDSSRWESQLFQRLPARLFRRVRGLAFPPPTAANGQKNATALM